MSRHLCSTTCVTRVNIIFDKFTLIRPLEYKHRRFAWCHCFPFSNNSPWGCIASISTCWRYLQNMYFMIPLGRVLLCLMHIWALILLLPFVVVVLHVARESDYHTVLLEWLPLRVIVIPLEMCGVDPLHHHCVTQIIIPPLMFDHPMEYGLWVHENQPHRLRLDDHLVITLGFC